MKKPTLKIVSMKREVDPCMNCDHRAKCVIAANQDEGEILLPTDPIPGSMQDHYPDPVLPQADPDVEPLLPILPVHDPFIVQHQYKQELRHTRQQMYKKHTGGFTKDALKKSSQITPTGLQSLSGFNSIQHFEKVSGSGQDFTQTHDQLLRPGFFYKAPFY